MKDQSAIKGKLRSKGEKTKLVSHFWLGQKRRVKKKRGKEKK